MTELKERELPLIPLEDEIDASRAPRLSGWARAGLMATAGAVALVPFAQTAFADHDESPATVTDPTGVQSPVTVNGAVVLAEHSPTGTLSPATVTGTVTISPSPTLTVTPSPTDTGWSLGELYREGNRAALATLLGVTAGDLDDMSLGEVLQVARDAGFTKAQIHAALTS